MKRIAFILTTCVFITQAYGQENSKNNLDTRVNILFGLNQIALGGFNIEGNFFHNRLAFDYSHGVNLNLSSEMLGGAYQQQELQAKLPWTTGFGVGYRFNHWLNLRVEPKWHRYEISYASAELNNANVVNYTTFTLGLGLYANWQPFRKSTSFIKGIMIAPSIRYWPNVASSLENNAYTYESLSTGKTETIEALNVGFGNTPWVFNISVGYSFPVK
jgi:hypothetical protein